MATDHGTATCGGTADKAPRFLVPWDFSVPPDSCRDPVEMTRVPEGHRGVSGL